MDLSTAKQYHKAMAELLAELQQMQSPLERQAVVLRMENLLRSLYVVDSNAGQHIEEALRKLKYPELAVVNASLHTIEEGLQRIYETIQKHTDPEFIVLGDERVFAKPVAELELRSLVEKERLFDSKHSPLVHALDAPQEVIDVLLAADVQTLKPVLSRLGFPNSDALVFFRTRVQPRVGYYTELMPSLKLVKFRSGIPVNVIKHRIL